MKLPGLPLFDFSLSRSSQCQERSAPRRSQILACLCIVTIIAIAGTILAAQEKTKLPGEDWVSLFNGSDLAGWTKIGHESWTVEDGVIHGKGLTAAYGYLETNKDYKDFQLSLRFKCVGDGNSGVFFHTGFKPGFGRHNAGHAV